MDKKFITVVVVVLLCVVGYAYSQGWLNWSRPGTEVESNKVGTDQMLDQDKSKEDAVPVTPETAEPADTATQ